MGCCSSSDDKPYKGRGRTTNENFQSSNQQAAGSGGRTVGGRQPSASDSREARAAAAEARAQNNSLRGTPANKAESGRVPTIAPPPAGPTRKDEPNRTHSAPVGWDDPQANAVSAALARTTSADQGISQQGTAKLQERAAKDELIGQIRELYVRLGEEPTFGTNAASLDGLRNLKRHLEQRVDQKRKINNAMGNR
eukprot:TRINITY_DN67396_c7_g1_i1.p1 TRINITY_DN67396_c7_g1~~TRINITY_DN67396_c7_g1_i1.p1  ORF type:complete len:203 (+),score=17.13 TRINITY_DN67396_c7_g1_i1:25-609(+)